MPLMGTVLRLDSRPTDSDRGMGNIGTKGGAKRCQVPYMRGGLCRTRQHQLKKRRIGCSWGLRSIGDAVFDPLTEKVSFELGDDSRAHPTVCPLGWSD